MEDDILIDNYLKGLLSENEQVSFSNRLESDADFKERFELEKQLFDALNEDTWSFANDKNSEATDYVKFLKEDDIQNLKKTLAETSSKFSANKNETSRRLFYYLAAASVVLFIGFQFFFNQNISNQELYNDYVALNDLPSFVSRSDGTHDLAKAQRLFENKEYQDALSIFQSQFNESDDKANIFIYQGLAQTELEKFDDAEKTFNKLISSDLLDAQKGHWYKALLYLKQDKVVESKIMLERIVTSSYYNHSKAKELLEKLNND